MARAPDNYPSVIVVMLRQPRSDANESRTDPYWEFGSFGTTGCHGRSVMNQARVSELDGKRFAFAQGGPLGMRLVHVTPPLRTRILAKNNTAEALWEPPTDGGDCRGTRATMGAPSRGGGGPGSEY